MTRKSTVSHIVMLLLPMCGIWPGRSTILITRLFWIASIAFIVLCQYLYFSTHLNPQDFFNLVHCFSSFLAYAKVFTKLVAFWINQQKLVETLALITDDWNDCANSDIGVRVTMHKAKLSDRITNAILILHTMTIVGYCLGAILAGADATDEAIELTYANKMQLPFNVNTQRTYRFVLIAEFMHLILCNLVAGVVNAILLTLAIGTPDAKEQIMKCLLFFSTTNLEAFIFCYAGEYLSNKSKTIGFAMYNCPWYNLRPNDSRVLLFVILRSQKQLTLTAGKMMELSLESFTRIMNASGSYLSVLLAMQ
ncbi:unnamed protein product [Lasius platythorax]|uniref:Odorant receptor n=1 Tax=Lasius platythorax TaxID=488582 RepID=A0AAV2N4K6_9HYME